MAQAFRLFASAPRGLEQIVAAEIRALPVSSVDVQRGGAAFETDLAGAYRACLWSRVANRVLLPLIDFEAEDDSGLYAGVGQVAWLDHLGPEQTLAVDFTGIRPAISHSRYGAQRVKDAIVDQLRELTGSRPSVDTRNPDVRINVHMHDRQVTVAVDLSGESLHRRGYRETGIPAPLKENLAAAMLLRGDWPELARSGACFLDPMCGTGTLAIEAAWMAGDVAPGLLRTQFGFLKWRGHDQVLWKAVVDEALERQEAGIRNLPPIHASDSDPAAIRLAAKNIRQAGLEGRIYLEQRELGNSRPPAGCSQGLVATNPPYGERIGEQHELIPLYLRIGETLKQHFGGWRALVLNGSGCEVGLKPEQSWQLFNGPIECRLERFDIREQPDGDRQEPAQDLVNRLARNRRRLKQWLNREGITCYRIYDADIPEYALAVDIYGGDDGDWLHVQEYEAPASVDVRQAQARLRAALMALPRALDIAPERLVFKVRRRQRGTEQYTRLSEQSKTLIVREGPVRLEVNLTDYLDTGLFLDHRIVRQWIGEQVESKRFLNLFCYTGAATAHAAAGGASETTSVDLSRTYLDWLKRNLALNNCDRAGHRQIRADAREWLAECRERFDLIFLDPPSFSTSKRMEGTLDIQRDHADLIRQAARCLSADGTLVFSTNLRRFRLDEGLEEEMIVENRSAWSIPNDFQRNPRIHQCWFLRLRN